MDPSLQKLIEVAASPLITAALAALGLWLSERRKDRNSTHVKRQAVADESSWVAYLKLWLETETLIGGDADPDSVKLRAEVRRQLAESRARASVIGTTVPQEDEPSALVRAWRRAALIPLTRPAARAVRWAYWIILVVGLLYSTAVMSGIADSEFDPFIVVIGAVITLIPLFAVALPLAYWSRALEAKGQQPSMRHHESGAWTAPPTDFGGTRPQGTPQFPPHNSYNPAAPPQPDRPRR